MVKTKKSALSEHGNSPNFKDHVNFSSKDFAGERHSKFLFIHEGWCGDRAFAISVKAQEAIASVRTIYGQAHVQTFYHYVLLPFIYF